MQPPSRILLLAWLLASGLLVAAEPVRPTQMPGDERGNEGDVFIMDLADGSRRVINPNDLLQDDPVWSPNGKHVAYLLSETGDYADRRIWVMDNNGNDARKLSANGYVTKVHWCGDDTLFTVVTRAYCNPRNCGASMLMAAGNRNSLGPSKTLKLRIAYPARRAFWSLESTTKKFNC